MNILVSNDDGINAEGIRRLAETLSGLGDVYVFAPDSERSASSHALSIIDDITNMENDKQSLIDLAYKNPISWIYQKI